MIVSVNDKLWREVYYRISNHDENLLLAYYQGEGEGGRYRMEEYLTQEYDIHIHKDPDGRWEAIELRDPNIITMILLKYEGEYHEAD